MVFHALHAARSFEKKHFTFIATAEDFDLVTEIGYYMGCGTPLTMKQMLLLDIASAATLQRRLARLKRLGAVVQRKSKTDARIAEFLLAPHVVEAFARYGELLGSVGTRRLSQAESAAREKGAGGAPVRSGRRATDVR
jgi:hypothetical protein